MARKQYRVYSPGNWTNGYGYSFVLISNVSGSNKKITVRQIECQVSSVNGGTGTTGTAPCTLYRSSAPLSGGEPITFGLRLDSSTSLPSGIRVLRRADPVNYTAAIRRVDLSKRSGAVGTQNRQLVGEQTNFGFGYKRSVGAYRNATIVTAVEPLIVNQNQAYVLVCDHTTNPYINSIRCNITLSVNGKTIIYNFISQLEPGVGVFAVENTGTAIIKIMAYSFAELGTTDTPTVRVVPVGQIRPPDLSDSTKTFFTPIPMNSVDGALSPSICQVFGDVDFIPYGVPEVYIADASAGSPKGMNYLHTKDFQGPTFRAFLPEVCHIRGVGVGIPDTFGTSYTQKLCDMGVRRKAASPATNIVINQGESLALVSSAETAVGVQAAYSGWPLLHFGLVLDVEPAVVPSIVISGMVQDSRWRVERVSDSSLVATGVADITGAVSFLYETEDTPLNLRLKVRKGTIATLYKPYEVVFNMTSAGVSIPVSQVSD